MSTTIAWTDETWNVITGCTRVSEGTPPTLCALKRLLGRLRGFNEGAASMDWIVGIMTIAAMELIARKYWQGWAVGLVNQALWFYLIVYQQQLWGLAILTVVLTWRYSLALVRWRRDAATTTTRQSQPSWTGRGCVAEHARTMTPPTIVQRATRDLTPYPRNHRKNDRAVNRMVASIQEFGFKVPILCMSDGLVVDGHLRLKAAQQIERRCYAMEIDPHYCDVIVTRWNERHPAAMLVTS